MPAIQPPTEVKPQSHPPDDGSSPKRQGLSGSAPSLLTRPSLSSVFNILGGGGGFEPPKLARQIYSLIPLATREPLQKGAHSLDVKEGCQH